MDFHRLVQEIDSEISRLQQARALLTGEPTKRGPRTPESGQQLIKLRRVRAASEENISAASLRKDGNALLTQCGNGGQNVRNNKGPGKSVAVIKAAQSAAFTTVQMIPAGQYVTSSSPLAANPPLRFLFHADGPAIPLVFQSAVEMFRNAWELSFLIPHIPLQMQLLAAPS